MFSVFFLLTELSLPFSLLTASLLLLHYAFVSFSRFFDLKEFFLFPIASCPFHFSLYIYHPSPRRFPLYIYPPTQRYPPFQCTQVPIHCFLLHFLILCAIGCVRINRYCRGKEGVFTQWQRIYTEKKLRRETTRKEKNLEYSKRKGARWSKAHTSL